MNGKIITFYSFKGGVGRTLALATISYLLARAGHKVLIVDWDLEAPGLGAFFPEGTLKNKGAGLLNMLCDFVQVGEVNYVDYLSEITVDGVSLYFLDSGDNSNGTYSEILSSFNWGDFYSMSKGGIFLERLRDVWKDSLDFVLIDSRTGLTDVAGVCTIQMPDIIVALFTPSTQSVIGVRDVLQLVRHARRKLAYDRMELTVLPLPTRFGALGYEKDRRHWIEQIAKHFAEWYSSWLPSDVDLETFVSESLVFQSDHLIYGEKLALNQGGRNVESVIADRFKRIATLISNNFQYVESIYPEVRESKIVKRPLTDRSYIESVEVATGEKGFSPAFDYDVFVSFPARAVEHSMIRMTVSSLQESLRVEHGRQVKMFMDERVIEDSMLWLQRIEINIQRSAVFLAFVDRNYFKNRWTRSEFDNFLRMGIARGSGSRQIVSVLLEGRAEDYEQLRDGCIVDVSSLSRVGQRNGGSPESAPSFEDKLSEIRGAILKRLAVSQNARHVGGNVPVTSTPESLDAPYNFVPLSEHVHAAERPQDISIDRPFSDGISGVLELEIEAHSPLCVGHKNRKASDGEPGRVRFFRLPDGTPAIPGSSLRGMIRNVMEIACFARMSLIDDRRFSLRDLTGAAKEDYARALVNKSKAGWLFFDNDPNGKSWKIRPCRFGRITHGEIAALGSIDAYAFSQPHGGKERRDARERREQQVGGGRDWPAGSAPRKYMIWQAGRHPSLAVDVIEGEPHSPYRREVPECRIARKGDGGRVSRGTLVFTGQPNTRKKREFVFLENQGQAIRITSKVWQAFKDIHEDQYASVEWLYWRDKYFNYEDVKGIPIFYLEKDGEVESIELVDALGLAMMFKLAGRFSTHQLRDNVQRPVDDDGGARLDLVEAIFGKVGKQPKDALRSRVSFGTAVLDNPDAINFDEHAGTVLGSPKPSYFPTYLRQKFDPARPTHLEARQRYRTYMSDDAELAGWKRYPVHATGDAVLPPLNEANKQRTAVQVVLESLRARGNEKPRFTSRLRFHNLRPFELGAVLWALRFGDEDGLRHAIGMAKPHGFGKLAIRLRDPGLTTVLRRNDGEETTAADCLSAFTGRMESWAKTALGADGWARSLQIQRLRAMADPQMALQWPAELRHMTLDPANRINEFVEAKRNRVVLAPYGDPALEARRLPIAAATAAAAPAVTPPAASHGPAAGGPSPPGVQAILHRAGTLVEVAGEQGRLVAPWIDGAESVTVDFDGEIEEHAVGSIKVSGS